MKQTAQLQCHSHRSIDPLQFWIRRILILIAQSPIAIQLAFLNSFVTGFFLHVHIQNVGYILPNDCISNVMVTDMCCLFHLYTHSCFVLIFNLTIPSDPKGDYGV